MSKRLVINYNDENQNKNYDTNFNENSIGFRTKNGNLIKDIFKFITTIIDQVNIKLSFDGIRFSSMDSSHISLIECFIPKNLFECYNISDREIVLGVNLKLFIIILNQLKNEDELIFIVNDNDTIDLVFSNKKYNKEYTLKLFEYEVDDLQVNEEDDTTLIEIDSKYFNDIITNFKDIGSEIRIKVLEQNQKISIKCNGEMSSLKMDLIDDIKYKNIKDLELFFQLENIFTFSKGYNLSKILKISVMDNFPMCLNFTIHNEGYINYYIAPKINDEDYE